MGNKLSKAINIEAHSASESVMKEFKRLGAEIKIIKFLKRSPKINKQNITTNLKSENVANPKSGEASLKKTDKLKNKDKLNKPLQSKSKKKEKKKQKHKRKLNNGLCF